MKQKLKLKFIGREPHRRKTLRVGKNETLSLVSDFVKEFSIKKDMLFLIGKAEEYPDSLFLAHPSCDPAITPLKVRRFGKQYYIRFNHVMKEYGIKLFSEFVYERFDDEMIKLTQIK